MKIKKTAKQKTKLVISTLTAAVIAVPAVGFAGYHLAQNHDSYAKSQAAADGFWMLLGKTEQSMRHSNQADSTTDFAQLTNGDIRPFNDEALAQCSNESYRQRWGNDLKFGDPITVQKQLGDLEELDCWNAGVSGDWSGMEYMVNLSRLDLSENGLQTFDASIVPSVTDLYLEDNHLTSVDVTAAPALEQLNVSGNQLTSVDISKNSKLSTYVNYDNQITEVDFSHNPQLAAIGIWNNQIKSVDVSNNPEVMLLAADDILVKTNIITDQATGAKDFDLNELDFIGPLDIFKAPKKPVYEIGTTFVDSQFYTFSPTTKILAVNDLEGTQGFAQIMPYCTSTKEDFCEKEEVREITNRLNYKLQLMNAISPEPTPPVPHTDGSNTPAAPNTGLGSTSTIVAATSIAAPTLIASLLVTRAIRNRKRGHIKFD